MATNVMSYSPSNCTFDKTSIVIVIFIIAIIYFIVIRNNKFTPDSVSLDTETIYPIHEYDGTDFTKDSEQFMNWRPWNRRHMRPGRPRGPWRGPWNRRWRGNMNYPRRSPWNRSWIQEYPNRYMNNPGCDGKACGGYCQPWNSKCCGGTKPFTCNRLSCSNNILCNS